MAIEHVNIADGERHEPKGISTANAGEVYIADGAASGNWGNLDNEVYMVVKIDDVSTASFNLLPLPANCVINSVKSVLHGAIATADATITITRGGDGLTLGTLTISNSGSAEGDINSNSSLFNNTLTTGSHGYIKIATDGASTNSVAATFVIKATI